MSNTMADETPSHVASALRAEESGALDAIIAARRPADLEALRTIAHNDHASFDNRDQRKALYALGRWGDPSLADDIAQVLPRLDPSSRIAAIDALGRLGGPAIVPIVTAYSDDESPQVRKFVVQALGRIGTPNALEELRRIRGAKMEEAWLRELADRVTDAPSGSTETS
jgi:HEAT repeat protein